MDNLYQKLEWRLRSVANGSYKADRDEARYALLYVELLTINNQIIGWLKPEVKLLEPRGIDIASLDLQPADCWASAVQELTRRGKGILIIGRGEPVGWLG